MPTIKDRVYVGNTYAVAFDCYEPQQTTNQTQLYSGKTPKNPDSAFAQLWDVQNQEFIEIGPNAATTDSCVIQGNTVYYTVASTALAVAGDYKIFVTIAFPDGQVVTESRTVKVQARS